MVGIGDSLKDISDDFSKGGGGMSFASSQGQLSERGTMIEGVYLEVLGRKPSSREISYYKYGTMKENDIRIKLLKSEEHTKVLENAKKLPNLEDELKDKKVSERKLIQQVEDIRGEMIQSQDLLNEKNSIIRDLRESVKNPYDLSPESRKYEEGFDVFNVSRASEPVQKEKQSFISVLKDIFTLLIKK